jgi:hypothetical protein
MRGTEPREKNRTKRVAEAVRMNHRRRAGLRRSLQHPHPESAEFAELGFEEWVRGLPDEDTETLVDKSAGRPVRWVLGEGWVEGPG